MVLEEFEKDCVYVYMVFENFRYYHTNLLFFTPDKKRLCYFKCFVSHDYSMVTVKSVTSLRRPKLLAL